MTHTLNNSMAGFVLECNISFNGGNLSSDTGAIRYCSHPLGTSKILTL